MTAGVLVSPAIKHPHHDPLPYALPFRVNRKSPSQKKSRNGDVNVRLKIDLKGKRHPSAIKKTIRVKINRLQVKNVLLRQIQVEEKSSLRMLGVAVFYANLLKKAKLDSSSNNNACPFCKSHNDDLAEKLQRDVKYLVNYAAKSTSKREKAKYFKAIEIHGFLPRIPSHPQNREVEFLRTSDKFLSLTDDSCSADLFEDIKDLKEVVQGKREALKLLKLQVLKSRKCGVCDMEVPASKLGLVLSSIDRTLSSL